MSKTRTLDDMSPGLLRVMERARRNPHERQRSLAYLVDVDALRRAYKRVRGNASVGVDGVSKSVYGQDLERNLVDLHGRLKSMKYRHQAIRRIHIPKDDGRSRPIGVSTVEDKIVQGALCEILGAIYEQDFKDSSYGFRPGRGCHDALRALNRQAREGHVNVVLEADIKSFFDSIDRPMLLEMLRQRIADKSYMRLVSKCLHAGVLEGVEFHRPNKGTSQGSIISPMLGNIYLHYVLDEWFEDEVKPRLKGRGTLIRYADDLIICFERMDDARRVMDVLGRRLKKYGLSLHPEKTRLIEFRRPPSGQGGGKGPGSFDFLGFTVFWRRNSQGRSWHLSWKTRKSRLAKAIKAIQSQCRRQRHWPVADQHIALVQRIQGHFNYYGVNDNVESLKALEDAAERAWFKWLNRRSQRSSMRWGRFLDLLTSHRLPKPRVYVNLWATS
ncbi:MAG: group II intron reverse transcriptase/maturase [Actinobacteria bacterium]|nr:group II intron reverse transcriptase/maturase [Actinomycetota bacterium]